MCIFNSRGVPIMSRRPLAPLNTTTTFSIGEQQESSIKASCFLSPLFVCKFSLYLKVP